MKSKRKLKLPFFSVNPKSYIYGDEILALALETEKIAKKYDMDIFFTAQLIDLPIIAQHTERLLLSAQHMDALYPGKGMGKILPDALINRGIDSVTLNHAENPITFTTLQETIKRANELGMITKVCANSVEEAKAIAYLKPDVIVCEKTELIGTGTTSDDAYIIDTIQAIKAIDKDIIVSQGAGIRTPEDVARMVRLGSEGSGASSGIIQASNRAELIEQFVVAMLDTYNSMK